MGRVAGKVALITGGARGQGRSHAIRLAEEGADIVVIDACAPIPGVDYEFPTLDDLKDTAAMVERHDRRVLARQVDIRDQEGLDATVAEALDMFGSIDIVVANAAVATIREAWTMPEQDWLTTIDINLTGTWRTLKTVIPSMIEAGRGGSIVVISSVGGTKGIRNVGHYVAAKHGVMGLAKTLANELGQHGIRVNCVQPGNVNTPMSINPGSLRVYRPDLEAPTMDDARAVLGTLTALPVDLIDPVDISNAVLWLASEESRFVTGISIPVDGGWLNS
jgi:SDR family mycofactocin-dependent oxidoreductase